MQLFYRTQYCWTICSISFPLARWSEARKRRQSKCFPAHTLDNSDAWWATHGVLPMQTFLRMDPAPLPGPAKLFQNSQFNLPTCLSPLPAVRIWYYSWCFYTEGDQFAHLCTDVAQTFFPHATWLPENYGSGDIKQVILAVVLYIF